MQGDKNINFFEKYIIHYKRMMNTPPPYDRVKLAPQKYRIIASWLPEDKSSPILDVGCGWGHLLLYLWATGYRNLTGVEYSKEQFEMARTFLPPEIRIINEDAKIFLRNTSAQFYCITMFDVIEHMPEEDAIELLQLIYDKLQPTGYVVIRTPNMANILGAYTRYMDLTHLTGYTEWKLFQLLDIAGFTNYKVLPPVLYTASRRWYIPWRGIGLREKLVAYIHLILYKILGMYPIPAARGINLIVQSFKNAEK